MEQAAKNLPEFAADSPLRLVSPPLAPAEHREPRERSATPPSFGDPIDPVPKRSPLGLTGARGERFIVSLPMHVAFKDLRPPDTPTLRGPVRVRGIPGTTGERSLFEARAPGRKGRGSSSRTLRPGRGRGARCPLREDDRSTPGCHPACNMGRLR